MNYRRTNPIKDLIGKPDVAGTTRFRGYLIRIVRVRGSAAQPYTPCYARPCGKYKDTPHFLPGDLHGGWWPTIRCAEIDGKWCVDEELKRAK